MNVYPYVYKVTHKVTNHFYIGYREINTISPEQDILEYKTSSMKVREMGFDNFKCEIIAIFWKGDDAYDYENRLIESSIKDPFCLNGHYTKEGKLRYRRVGPHSIETRELQSRRRKGTVFSEDHRLKLSKSQLGKKQSAETIEKRKISTGKRVMSSQAIERIRLSLIGHNVTQETREKLSLKISGRVHINNGMIAKMVTTNELESFLQLGWVRGRI